MSFVNLRTFLTSLKWQTKKKKYFLFLCQSLKLSKWMWIQNISQKNVFQPKAKTGKRENAARGQHCCRRICHHTRSVTLSGQKVKAKQLGKKKKNDWSCLWPDHQERSFSLSGNIVVVKIKNVSFTFHFLFVCFFLCLLSGPVLAEFSHRSPRDDYVGSYFQSPGD